MSQRRVRSASPISGLPFIKPDTSKSLKAVCASSAASRATTSRASTNATAPSLAYGLSNVLSLLHLASDPSLSSSHIEPTGVTALDNAGKDVWKFVSLHPHDIEPFVVDQAAMDIIGLDPTLWAPVNAMPFKTSTSQPAIQPSELGSSFYIDAPVLGSSHNLDSLIPPIESRPIVLHSAKATPPQSSRLTAEPLAPQFMQTPDSLPALSDGEARSLIEEYIMAAPWFREHTQEPLVGGEGVPTCALQLAPKGGSIYQCFVVPGKSMRNKPIFKCATCDYTSDRLHRVVGHQRIKRNHKPFVCGDVGW